MSMFKRFASVAHPDKYGYIFDTANSEFNRAAVCGKFLFYETFGHGLIQHSKEVPIQPEMLPDFLMSAMPMMLEDAEFCQEMEWHLDRSPSESAIRFARSVRYKAGVKRYYSLSESKVLANPKLQHDRRYEEVPEWADGSGEATIRLLMRNKTDYAEGIEYYATATAVREYVYRTEESPYMDSPSAIVGWYKGDRSDLRDWLRQSYQLVLALARAARARKSATDAIENYQYMLARRAEQQAGTTVSA